MAYIDPIEGRSHRDMRSACIHYGLPTSDYAKDPDGARAMDLAGRAALVRSDLTKDPGPDNWVEDNPSNVAIFACLVALAILVICAMTGAAWLVLTIVRALS